MKSIKAFLLGYLVFEVNGQRFWTYGAARQARIAVPQEQSVTFRGWNVRLWLIRDKAGPWRSFYSRFSAADIWRVGFDT